MSIAESVQASFNATAEKAEKIVRYRDLVPAADRYDGRGLPFCAGLYRFDLDQRLSGQRQDGIWSGADGNLYLSGAFLAAMKQELSWPQQCARRPQNVAAGGKRF